MTGKGKGYAPVRRQLNFYFQHVLPPCPKEERNITRHSGQTNCQRVKLRRFDAFAIKGLSELFRHQYGYGGLLSRRLLCFGILSGLID